MASRRSSPQALTPAMLAEAVTLPDLDGREAQRRMEPARRGPLPAGAPDRPPRPAAALAYVFAREGRLLLPLTVRQPDLPEHKGQVSLPGGRPAPDETSWETALREADEEIGLRGNGVEPLGVLAPVFIPVTHTMLSVHVATGPDPGELTPCPREVERIELVSLDDLSAPAARVTRPYVIQGETLDVPYFDVNGLFLWGATAMGLSELVVRLDRVRTLRT